MAVAGYSSSVRYRVFLLALITAVAGLVLTLSTTPPSATATQQSVAADNSAGVESSNPNNPMDEQISGDAQAIAYINAQGAGTVAGIAAGGEHTCARTTGGAAFCWGGNDQGELGTGETEEPAESYVPVRVVGGAQPSDFLSDVQEISAGYDHTCVRTGNNIAFCWGQNADGQLGNPDAGDEAPAPVQVQGLSDVRQISAGSYHTCAVTGNEAAFCWGENKYNQLGILTPTDPLREPTPVQVCGAAATDPEEGCDGDFLSDVTQISAGGKFTCAVVNEDAAYCWGANSLLGQLGNGIWYEGKIMLLVRVLFQIKQMR